MSTLPQIIIPKPAEEERLRTNIIEVQKRYWVMYDERNAAPPLDNIRFTPDPDWRNQWLSIQNAHDVKHPVWKVVWVLWFIAGNAFALAPLIASLLGWL